jgi:ubiquinone/menaquinone biosynthesis C-methylase UbiE/uncharacterized protein YbaR (Trm112 family)
MDHETISLLCNPYTHNPLRIIKTQAPDGTWLDFLEDIKTGDRFPFKDGIPVLYDISRLEGYNLRFNAFYRKVAGYYDLAIKSIALFSGGGEEKFRREYLDLLEINDNSKVLEVSVGTGANFSLLLEQARCYGLDLSWDMLHQCQKNMARWNRRFELFYGNAEMLPFRDAMFDVVFHVGGINAFNDRAKAIREMIRVECPGTKIVIVDETIKTMRSISWMPNIRKMIEEWGDRFEAPVNLVPPEMREIQADLFVNGFLYILSFRKP